eukprot:420783-Amorphochlora_amoeboformis.AAC.2
MFNASGWSSGWVSSRFTEWPEHTFRLFRCSNLKIERNTSRAVESLNVVNIFKFSDSVDLRVFLRGSEGGITSELQRIDSFFVNRSVSNEASCPLARSSLRFETWPDGDRFTVRTIKIHTCYCGSASTWQPQAVPYLSEIQYRHLWSMRARGNRCRSGFHAIHWPCWM